MQQKHTELNTFSLEDTFSRYSLYLDQLLITFISAAVLVLLRWLFQNSDVFLQPLNFLFFSHVLKPRQRQGWHIWHLPPLLRHVYQYATCSQNHCAILVNYWCLGRTGLIWEASEIPQTDDDSIWWPSPGQGTQLNTSIPQPVLNTHAWAHSHKHTYTLSHTYTMSHIHTHTCWLTLIPVFPMHTCIYEPTYALYEDAVSEIHSYGIFHYNRFAMSYPFSNAIVQFYF